MQPFRQVAAVFVLATGSLAATGITSGAPPQQPSHGMYVTTSGFPFSAEPRRPSRRRGGELMELRRLTGLTWDQVANLFSVSRRSVFLWASGKPMSADNELLLARLLAFIQNADRGSARANRQLLLGSAPDGHVVLDLLAEGRIDEAREAVSTALAPSRLVPKPLSAAERRHREPPRPHELLGALQDTVHTGSGRIRSVRKARSLRDS